MLFLYHKIGTSWSILVDGNCKLTIDSLLVLSSDVNFLQLQLWLWCILKMDLGLIYAKCMFPSIMVRSAMNLCTDSWSAFLRYFMSRKPQLHVIAAWIKKKTVKSLCGTLTRENISAYIHRTRRLAVKHN